jgi:hypothetical protein
VRTNFASNKRFELAHVGPRNLNESSVACRKGEASGAVTPIIRGPLSMSSVYFQTSVNEREEDSQTEHDSSHRDMCVTCYFVIVDKIEPVLFLSVTDHMS